MHCLPRPGSGHEGPGSRAWVITVVDEVSSRVDKDALKEPGAGDKSRAHHRAARHGSGGLALRLGGPMREPALFQCSASGRPGRLSLLKFAPDESLPQRLAALLELVDKGLYPHPA